eukprot:CAMPEP_0183355242 /NCGR_PEP_ID=MMETSP0164_2-20130417/39594_1 /TAXON_ID=221442 /ORGANISM="Coccolithus pelagicus ssp braarudi, Strain PLY182g" /LENGTH=52 /DNA_ID=CAMNT_0025528285 /DNA_START=69 /DNA_END=228 /DNA_ORIENTATION=-
MATLARAVFVQRVPDHATKPLRQAGVFYGGSNNLNKMSGRLNSVKLASSAQG